MDISSRLRAVRQSRQKVKNDAEAEEIRQAEERQTRIETINRKLKEVAKPILEETEMTLHTHGFNARVEFRFFPDVEISLLDGADDPKEIEGDIALYVDADETGTFSHSLSIHAKLPNSIGVQILTPRKPLVGLSEVYDADKLTVEDVLEWRDKFIAEAFPEE